MKKEQNPGVSWGFSTLFPRCEFIIFVDNGDGMLREIGQVTETVDGSTFPSTDIYDWPTADPALTADGHDKTKASTENDTPITLVVLSERAWANMTWTQVPAANNGYYQNGTKVADVTSNQLAATNEDGKKVYNVFNVDLTVNEPNNGAEFSRFALNGYTGTH